MNGGIKAKRENRRYLRSHNESRDEWVFTHSFFHSFIHFTDIYLAVYVSSARIK